MNCQFKSLNWDHFEDYLSTTTQNLLTDEYFTDVTLVSEDHKPFRAHKIILSACSPVFKSLLLMNASSLTQQTVLYLRGVDSQEMEALLEFIYLGKTDIIKENFEEFLVIANDFKICGLTEDNSDSNIPLKDNPTNTYVESEKENTAYVENLELNIANVDIIKENEVSVENVEESVGNVKSEFHELQIEEEHQTYACDQCPYVTVKKFRLKGHVRDVHGEAKYSCDDCPFKTRRRDSLRYHILSKHQGARGNQNQHSCDQCDFTSSRPDRLKVHIQLNHKGNKYPCDDCNYQASQKSHLKAHIDAQHSGLIYECSKCNYSAKSEMNLKKHQRTIHDGVKYSCDKCSFQTAHPESLKRHLLVQHGHGSNIQWNETNL